MADVLRCGALPVYANDGVHLPATGTGFQVYSAQVGDADFDLRMLNPQTQMKVFRGR